MSNNMITPSDFFNPDTQVAHLGLIACPLMERRIRPCNVWVIS